MNNIVPKIIIILGIALLTQPLAAIDDIETKACNVEKYTKCMGTSASGCINAYKKSSATCLELYPIEQAMDLEKEKEIEFAKKYISCVNDKYLKILNVNQEKYYQCTAHLSVLLEENYKNILKKHKENQEKLRNLEEATLQ